MRQKLIILASLTILASIFLFLSCCEDCPPCPTEPEPPPLGNYRLYVFDGWNQFIMSVDTPADTIVDSIRTDYSGAFICVTPDGNRLLVMRFDSENGHKIEVYNTSDLSHVETLTRYGIYYFDSQDNYGICKASDDVFFIDPTNLTAIDSISLASEAGYLDTTTNSFFALSGVTDSTYAVYQIDCISRSVIDTVYPPCCGGITVLAYNWLTDDLYFLALGLYYSYFHQYDIDSDSIVNTTYIKRPNGSVSVSPDGRRVYMTDGGDAMFGDIPAVEIWIFDALTHRPIDWIPPYDTSTGQTILPFFGQIIITPDNRRAYIGGANSSTGDPVAVADLHSNLIIKTISPYYGFTACFLAVGPVPAK